MIKKITVYAPLGFVVSLIGFTISVVVGSELAVVFGITSVLMVFMVMLEAALSIMNDKK